MARSLDERSLLLARIDALLEELRQAGRDLERLPLDPFLRAHAQQRFEQLLPERRKAIEQTRQRLVAGAQLDVAWDEWREHQQDCVALFRECLAFLQGAVARSQNLDGGLCRIADALLADLSDRADAGWQRFTLMAEGEFFTDMVDIIRLRYPEASLWNLPVAAHEFGHFAGSQLRRIEPGGLRSKPFEEWLKEEVETGGAPEAFLHEHFADGFATYALGPAYACTCLLLRFNPLSAFDPDDDRDHPNDAKRAVLILGVLAWLNEQAGGAQPYSGVIAELERAWGASLAAAGHTGETLDDETHQQLRAWWRSICEMLPEKLRYTGWARAAPLSRALAARGGPADVLGAVPGVPGTPGACTLQDVLNAAWLCRLQDWSADSQALGQKARQVCELWIAQAAQAAAIGPGASSGRREV